MLQYRIIQRVYSYGSVYFIQRLSSMGEWRDTGQQTGDYVNFDDLKKDLEKLRKEAELPTMEIVIA